MADEKRSPVQEMHDRVCADIHAAWDRFSKGRKTLCDRYENDWMRRDLEAKILHAQFVLETADLERNRMMLLRTMVQAKNASPIAGLVVTGN